MTHWNIRELPLNYEDISILLWESHVITSMGWQKHQLSYPIDALYKKYNALFKIVKPFFKDTVVSPPLSHSRASTNHIEFYKPLQKHMNMHVNMKNQEYCKNQGSFFTCTGMTIEGACKSIEISMKRFLVSSITSMPFWVRCIRHRDWLHMSEILDLPCRACPGWQIRYFGPRNRSASTRIRYPISCEWKHRMRLWLNRANWHSIVTANPVTCTA